MCHSLEPRQTEKTASAFDGVDETEDVAEEFRIVWILLEFDKLGVERVHTLGSFRQEFLQQVVHGDIPLLADLARTPGNRPDLPFRSRGM
jgi:hypothetical protein